MPLPLLNDDDFVESLSLEKEKRYQNNIREFTNDLTNSEFNRLGFNALETIWNCEDLDDILDFKEMLKAEMFEKSIDKAEEQLEEAND